MWFLKKEYLTWPEYSEKIRQMEMLDFISKTTLKSVNNELSRR